MKLAIFMQAQILESIPLLIPVDRILVVVFMGHVIEIFPYSRHRQPKLILWERYADVVESGWKCNEHSAAARKMLESVENELPYPCVEFLCTCVPLNFVMSDPLLIKFHVSMRVFFADVNY